MPRAFDRLRGWLKAAGDKGPMVLASGDVAIAAGEGQENPKAQIVAYSGGVMDVPGWGPVVLDIRGLDCRDRSLPILADHDSRLAGVVGHGVTSTDGRSIEVAASIAPVNDAARAIVGLAKAGVKFQASVGVKPLRYEYVRDGAAVTVNGRTIKADSRGFLLVRRGKLREVSITVLGADDTTSVSVAATSCEGVDAMTFEQWLEAKGFVAAELSDAQRKYLEARYQAEVRPEEGPGTGDAQPPDPALTAGAKKPAGQSIEARGDADPDPVLELRLRSATELKRINALATICREHPEIHAKAIAEGWTEDKARLECLLASRECHVAIHAGGQAPTAKILEAGLCLAIALPEEQLLKAFGAETLERGDRFRRVGFKELMAVCCQLEGRAFPGIGASDADLIRAGFSTAALSGILSNVGHKAMMAAYTAVPALADTLAKRLTASDFKTHTGYRMTGDSLFKQVGAAGELTHGTLGEASYTYAVDTYGRMFGLTRQMQINDDLGAFAEIPRLIGRGAALMKERLFWTLVLANTGNFFHADNKNLITTVLGSAGLKAAVQKLEEQTDGDGHPVLVMGKYLVTPPALRETADELYVSTNVNTGGASTSAKVPNRNIYAGRYQPQSTPYLGNTTFHASASSTAWYLWGDPADVAAFGVAYLNGRTAPVVEDAPLSAEYLGQAWRGYLDYGVCQIDHRGAVKSTGAG